MFKDECDVYYSEDNGRFTVYTLWQANQMYRTHGAFDIVHWNNGSWNMNTEPPMENSEGYHQCAAQMCEYIRKYL